MKKVVAIGALGGSGTRAFAQVLIDAGVYMGDDLNNPNDNLIFTRLFKNPEWYRSASDKDVAQRLAVFHEYMETNSLSLRSAAILIKASLGNPIYRHHRSLARNITKKLFQHPTHREIWGWKEPNTQLYIEQIEEYFPSLKYIYIARHGLDMAFSKNKQQLRNWGFRYDIRINENETSDELAYKQLEFWIRSTRESVRKGREMGSRFLLLNHTDFCMNPEEQVNRLLDFLELDVDVNARNALYKIPEKPPTLDRFKQQNLQIFDRAQLEFVEELGFRV